MPGIERTLSACVFVVAGILMAGLAQKSLTEYVTVSEPVVVSEGKPVEIDPTPEELAAPVTTLPAAVAATPVEKMEVEITAAAPVLPAPPVAVTATVAKPIKCSRKCRTVAPHRDAAVPTRDITNRALGAVI